MSRPPTHRLQVLLLDNERATAEPDFHLLRIRHILLALLYLLISGGGQAALSFGEPGRHGAFGEVLVPLFLEVSLETVAPNEGSGNGRPTEDRRSDKNFMGLCREPSPPATLRKSPAGALDIRSATGGPKRLIHFARAPPSFLE
jgi:hypothetical protein